MDRRSSSVDDQVAELTRRLPPEATAIKTARSLAELRSEPNEERTAFSTCFAGALDVMRYNTLNDIRTIPLVSKSLVVLSLIGAAISWLFLWGLTTVLAELVIVEAVSLGPRFGTMTTVVGPLVALPIATRLALIKPRRASRSDEWMKRHPRKAALIFIAASLLMTGVAMSLRIIEFRSRVGDAEAALQSFVPIYGPGVDPAKVERTLAEFERAHSHLADKWHVPDTSPRISLYLFRDIREYKAYMSAIGFDWSGGYASCLEDGVNIGVPLEDASNVFEETPASRTPLHEMVHATWCQSLGRSSYRSIPRWFHEGMAQRYANEGWRQFPERAMNRWVVWIDRGNLLPATEFCGYTSGGSRAEINVLYRTSWELIRTLESGYGIQSLNAVVEDLGAGKSFDDSLRDRFGGSCSELYATWLRNL